MTVTPIRNIRIPDDLWQAAKAKADSRHERQSAPSSCEHSWTYTQRHHDTPTTQANPNHDTPTITP